MSNDIEVSVRSSNAYSLAVEAIRLMEVHGVWPTPLNYEIWLYVAGDPNSALAQEIHRLIGSGEKITEEISESLASKFISRLKLNDEVRDAGLRLTRELASVSEVISEAQKAQKDYNETLEGARSSIDGDSDAQRLRQLVGRLTDATSQILNQHAHFEVRLSESSREVARLRKHLDQVRLEAMTDALTNLANRKSFDEALERHCDSDEGKNITLAVLDIDHFKRFNDTWGHQTGDQVLRYVASVLSRIGRAPRMAARYGGEEFAMIFPSENMAVVERLLNEARQEIASRVLKRRSTNEDLGTITISVGIAERDYGEDAYDLLDRADKALYQSKNNGRNMVTCAKSALKATDAA
ncbi:GGDEF domain-containing protein [Asticcacaulis excentricus]|uniref:diguanylate cyclase n=1 Tax=Asticcacaulis excentricus (strain ATCC 15261 / DSM 4724 / KCTC 12464 / NCIMB 9791 / VKM B-1370 / CB 48) TaxID=573065 RepID=E8RSD9_ASTEC|nr:GGDEF domain-containing protein [Asticcacaulis excentricus]ADU14410.1 diguanylate cyclase [Asticcacaulis excentricus CB 48]